MSISKISVTPQFKANFELVCARFECSPEEVEIMKDLVRMYPEAAMESFNLMAQEINPAIGINERIRDALSRQAGSAVKDRE